MEYTAEIIRGWPGEGAVETNETIKASVTLNNGDVVEKQSDGTIDKVSGTANGRVGLVVRGNGDSASASNVNKAVVLWSNYVVRIKTSAVGSTVAWIPGVAVTAKSGKFDSVTVTDAATAASVLGFCLGTTAASTGINGTDASITIAVK